MNSFLSCRTPDIWLENVGPELTTLLIDHANCEKKAASTALNLMYRYVDKTGMLPILSKLAREELRHFEQVLAVMSARDISYRHLSPSRYAGSLREDIRKNEPGRLIDTLVVSAIIEARSCERFEKLVEVLDEPLAEFYQSLLNSEARHFNVYIDLANQFAPESIEDRVSHFLRVDQSLILSVDSEFRFHSGVPGECQKVISKE